LEVHLKYTAAYLTCTDVVKDAKGIVTEVKCTLNNVAPETREPAQPKIKGHLHWVSAKHAVPCTFNLYDRLFLSEEPEAVGASEQPAAEDGDEVEEKESEGPSFLDNLRPDSLIVKPGFVESDLFNDAEVVGKSFQFERVGFFCVDKDSTKAAPIFNRVVTLKESKDKKTL